MKKITMKAGLGCAMLALAGCGGTSVIESHPLFFAQGISFGLTGGTAPQNGNTPDFTVGYKQLNVAIVPTVVANVDATNPEALTAGRIRGQDGIGEDINGNKNVGKKDALSTFGSFEASGKTNEVELGVFFATGVAASTLATGFKCKLAGSTDACAKAISVPEKQ